MSDTTSPRIHFAGFVLIISVLAAPALTQTQTRLNEPVAIDLSNSNAAVATKAEGRPAEVSDYEKLLAEDPNDPVVENNLGALYFSAGRYEEAANLIRRAADARPDISGIQVNASVALAHGNDFAAALKYAETAYKLTPKEIRPRQQLCDMYLAVHRGAEAVPCFETLAKDSKDVQDLLGFGEALVMNGEPDKADAVLREVISASPRYAGAYNALGMSLFGEKKYKDAVDVFRQAVSLMPEESSYRYNMAVADMAMRNKAGALSQYNFLKQSDPKMADQLYRAMFADKVVVVGH